MTVWPTAARRDLHWPRTVLDVLSKAPAYVLSFIQSYLGVLGLGCFVVAGFLVGLIVGFVVMGVMLLILDKAVKREANS